MASHPSRAHDVRREHRDVRKPDRTMCESGCAPVGVARDAKLYADLRGATRWAFKVQRPEAGAIFIRRAQACFHIPKQYDGLV